MSTSMETNTEQLQEILQTVYALPEVGGSSSEPDMVVSLTMRKSGATSENTAVTIESGSLEAVAEAFRAGRPPLVRLKRYYVINDFSTSYPIVESGIHDCDVLYYNGYITVEAILGYQLGIGITWNLDDADYLHVWMYPMSCTSIQVI